MLSYEIYLTSTIRMQEMSRCHRLLLTPKIFKLDYLCSEDLAPMKVKIWFSVKNTEIYGKWFNILFLLLYTTRKRASHITPFSIPLHENVKWLKWLSIKRINFLKKLNITLTLYFPLKMGCLRKTKLDKSFCAWMNNRKAKPPGLWGGTLSPLPALMCLGDKAP